MSRPCISGSKENLKGSSGLGIVFAVASSLASRRIRAYACRRSSDSRCEVAAQCWCWCSCRRDYVPGGVFVVDGWRRHFFPPRSSLGRHPIQTDKRSRGGVHPYIWRNGHHKVSRQSAQKVSRHQSVQCHGTRQKHAGYRQPRDGRPLLSACNRWRARSPRSRERCGEVRAVPEKHVPIKTRRVLVKTSPNNTM